MVAVTQLDTGWWGGLLPNGLGERSDFHPR
jgi:hypothetical protein